MDALAIVIALTYVVAVSLIKVIVIVSAFLLGLAVIITIYLLPLALYLGGIDGVLRLCELLSSKWESRTSRSPAPQIAKI